MRIEKVAMKNFPPFVDGTISFPLTEENGQGEVHLITGQNGCGKTRLLTVLAAACGNSKDLDTRHPADDAEHRLVVVMGEDDKKAIYLRASPHIEVLRNSADLVKILDNLDTLDRRSAGAITIPDGGRIKLERDSIEKRLFYSNLSTRVAVQAYRGTGRITDHAIEAMKAIPKSDPMKYVSFDRSNDDDALVCQSMANLKLSAAMELQSGEPPERCRSIKITERFEAAISKVTGRHFSFQVARHPDLHLEVKWGGMSMKLAVLPDGLRSIIAWLIGCVAKLESQFPDNPTPLDIPMILLVDEPESHLHPAWQRQVIPAAQALFPNAQFFVVTHSPFVISSVNVGWIHILRLDADGRATADTPIPCSKGDSYLDAVEDVLGLTQWYDPETENLLTEFRQLKSQFSEGKQSLLNTLETKADLIGSRSDSLKGMMAREIHQLRTTLAQGTVEQ